jgi:hypothetical protein
VLSISSGHSASYLTDAVAAGRENYYTGAVAAGEPPGRWSGRGAERLGLRGEVDTQDMTALYERFIHPRDENVRNPDAWDDAATLGHAGRRYLTADEIYAAALEGEPGADAERRAALQLEAGKKARKNVAFLDATFSVQKSITVLHTAFEAQEVRARGAAVRARAALDALTGAAGADGGAPVRVGAVRTGRVRGLIEAERAALAEAEGWATHRKAVEDAIWAGNRAALDYLAGKAGYSRVGHHGGAAGRWVDAHDWTIASFFQHDNRDHDPQLHIHNAILNRVEGADGKWRTLDGKAIYRHRGAAAAVGERVTEQHLARALGVEFKMRPDGKAREIVGIDRAVMDLFSSRRRAITAKTSKLVAAFEARFGREPNALELSRLQQQATFATRRAKTHDGETVEQRLERWDRQLRAEIAGGLKQLADQVLAHRGKQRGAERWTKRDVVQQALAAVQETKAAWTAADLTRAISDALPDHLGRLRPDRYAKLLDTLTAQALQQATPLDAPRPAEAALPADLRRADGTSAYEQPGARLYATPDHVRSERVLANAAYQRGAPALDTDAAAGFTGALAEQGIELGADQAAALRGVLTSGAMVETLIGPAGTGKSFVVGAIAKAWTDPELWAGQPAGRVVGLAASQIATEVLADEGLTARNIARWLDTQQRLAANTAVGEDTAWVLRAGDLIVVDESAMANTADLAKIHAHCKAAGAKLLLVGDHRQLAAVGAAGGMELVAVAGPRHELTETRRFTAEWEGAASLRLRAHDESVLDEYHKHGRLIDGGAIEQTEAAATRAWLADTLTGKHSLLIVDTNEQAARLSAQLRADLVRLGKVAEQGVPLPTQGTVAGPGDLVQARRNAWELAGYAGNRRAPINRDTYRVLATRPDGGLIVRTVRDGREVPGDTLRLPAEYVAGHVTLAYASTVHAAQGRTVDTCHTVATGNTSPEALYVGMTRGRGGNHAYVVTLAVPGDAPTGAALEAVHRSPRAVLAATFETAGPELSALAEATKAATRVGQIRTPAELLADAAEIACAGRTVRWLDELAEAGQLTESERMAIAAEDGASKLALLLRRAEIAGHDPKQVLTDAVERHALNDARQITNVLHRRITDTTTLDPVDDSYREWVPTVDDPQWAAYLNTLAAAADARRDELGQQVAAAPPQWAVEAFGEPPAEAESRAEWVERAGKVAAHRELVGNDDAEDALGPAPKPGQVEAYASWRSAWRALGRPDADRAEAEMSTGQLRLRVRAYEREKTWAPAYVANELAATRQAADRHLRDAALRGAESEAAPDDETARRLDREATEAAALASVLKERADQLERVDQARAEWYAHTVETPGGGRPSQGRAVREGRRPRTRHRRRTSHRRGVAGRAGGRAAGRGPAPRHHRRPRTRRRRGRPRPRPARRPRRPRLQRCGGRVPRRQARCRRRRRTRAARHPARDRGRVRARRRARHRPGAERGRDRRVGAARPACPARTAPAARERRPPRRRRARRRTRPLAHRRRRNRRGRGHHHDPHRRPRSGRHQHAGNSRRAIGRQRWAGARTECVR